VPRSPSPCGAVLQLMRTSLGRSVPELSHMERVPNLEVEFRGIEVRNSNRWRDLVRAILDVAHKRAAAWRSRC
jgi:hypothetical protein